MVPAKPQPFRKTVIFAFGFIILVLWTLPQLGRTHPSAAQALSPGEVRVTGRAYQPRPLRSETPIVEMDVVVRDNRGRPVPNLSQADFEVSDDGHRRELTSFSTEVNLPPSASLTGTSHAPTASNAPAEKGSGSSIRSTAPVTNATVPPESPSGRWVAVLFDDVNTDQGDLVHAKIASTRFVKEASAGGDHIAVFTSSGLDNLGFTTDRSAILAKISQIQAHSRMSPKDSPQCPRISPYEAYHIVNQDPVVTQAKLSEACACADSGEQCGPAPPTGPTDFLHPSASPDKNTSDPETSGGLSTGIIEIRADAQAVWAQSRLISQASLEEIKGALDYLTKAPGKRVVLLATDGFYSWTFEGQEQEIIDEAVHAGVVINSIDAKGLYAAAPGPPIDELVQVTDLRALDVVLQTQSLGDQLNNEDAIFAQFAESTGGLLFRNNNDLELGFHELGVAPEYSYLLGFPPTEDGRYHKVKIELKNRQRGLFIQARPGYFAPHGNTAQASPEDRIDAAMMSAQDETSFPVNLSEQLNAGSNGERQLVAHIHVDIGKIPFQKQEDRHVQKLTLILGVFDAKGNFIAGKEADMDLALKSDSFQRLSKEGIGGTMQFGIPPGMYRLRTVVAEGLHGSLSSVSHNVRVE